MYWFTSDYHLGHGNIIGLCNRPFKNLEHMNNAIIRNHNNRVKPTDTVFHVGDFCFKNSVGGKVGEGTQNKAEYFIEKLNGRFVFIRGNHDFTNSLKTIIDGVIINIGNKNIYLVHDPKNYEPNIKINFVGHIHQKWKFKHIKRHNVDLINVGCDVWKFMPVSYNEIMNEYVKWKKKNTT